MYSEESLNFRIAVLGDQQSGKTSLLLRYIQSYFSEDYSPTLSASILNKQVTVKDSIMKLTFYDLSGSPHFKSNRSLYFNNMDCYLIVLALNPDVMTNLTNWFTDIQEFVRAEASVVVVINKKDCFSEESEKIVCEIEAFADCNSLVVFKTSAKTGENVKELFESLLKTLAKSNLTITKGSLKLDKQKHVVEEKKESKCCDM